MPRAQLAALLAIAVFVAVYLAAGSELYHLADGFLTQLHPRSAS